MTDSYATRRGFLRRLPAVGAALVGLVAARPVRAMSLRGSRRVDHPDPRPGIDASKVMPRERLAGHPDLIPLFDHVREMPGICDGIACRCGCHEDPAMRSLLSCFEGEAMAIHCSVCQGQAETAYRLFRRGKSLADIRRALDADFG